MKKLILITTLFVISSKSLLAQSLEEDRKLYLNQIVIVQPNDEQLQKYGYDGFIKDIKKNKRDFKNIVFCEIVSSSYDSLVNRSFVVEEVNDYDKEQRYLKLSNKEIGTIYKIYTARFGPLDLKTKKSLDERLKRLQESEAIVAAEKASLVANPCPLIEDEYDEIDKTKDFKTPSSFNDVLFRAVFIKSVKKGIGTYYLSLKTIGNIPLANEKGLTIVLVNGKMIRKPAAVVETDVNSDGDYVRSSFINLTPVDIALLKTSPIKKFRLYIDDEEVEQGDVLHKLFLCLLTKK